jgi:hypothetical protein
VLQKNLNIEYQRFNTALNWNSAKTACADLSGHLATITSQAENDCVYGNVLFVRITQQQAYASKRPSLIG